MVIIFAVKTVQEKLAEFVRRRMAEVGLTSTYKVAARSGGLVSNTTVWNVLNGTYKDIGVITLKGLAKALDIEEDLIFNVIKDKPADKSEFQQSPFYDLSLKFERLAEGEKKEMNIILKMVKSELERRGRIKPKIESESKKERTRGTVMKEAKGEVRYTPEEIVRIFDAVRAQGFKDFDKSILDVLANNDAADIDPALKNAILIAAGKIEDPDFPKLKSNGA